MLLNRDQILSLYAEKKGRGITNKQLAEATGLTEATISRYFNFKLTLSDEKERDVRNYINNKAAHVVYRFINEDDEVVYIGKSSKGIDVRLSGHLNNNTHQIYKYLDVEKIEFIELDSSVDASIVELYLINKYNPKYNVIGTFSSKSSLDIDYPNGWKVYPIEKFKKLLVKKINLNTDGINVPEHELEKYTRIVKSLKAKFN